MLVGSILIGALAGFALLNYVNGVEQDVEQRAQRVPVWVFTSNVEAGTSAAQVQSGGQLEQAQVESQFRPDTAILDLSQIQGRVAVGDVPANQILVQGMFDEPETIETTFADLIEPDQIAFSINIAPNRAVAGFLSPGDFVDIIVREDFVTPVGDTSAFGVAAVSNTPYDTPARFLFRGVRVVGIGQEIVGQEVDPALAAAGEPVAETLEITLAVPSDAAQKILSVNEEDIVLALHPDQWLPEARANDIPDLIQLDEALPGESGDLITPYGPDGFVSVLPGVDLVEDTAPELGQDIGPDLTEDDNTDSAGTDIIEDDDENQEG